MDRFDAIAWAVTLLGVALGLRPVAKYLNGRLTTRY